MAWTGSIAAGISAVSKLLSAGGDQYSSSKAYRRSVNTAQHAHQWEVQDLRKAGLNPILSAGGQGASAQAFQAAPMDLDFSGALSKGAQADLFRQQEKVAESQVKLNDAASADHLASAARQISEREEIAARIGNILQDTDLKKASAWSQVGAILEVLPRIYQLGSSRHMLESQAGMYSAMGRKLRSEGLISEAEYDMIQRNPELFKEKVFGIPQPIRAGSMFGDKAKGIYERVKRAKQERRFTNGLPKASSGGKVGGF